VNSTLFFIRFVRFTRFLYLNAIDVGMVGAKPSFSDLDVVLTFLLMGSSKSRIALTKQVGVGEGAMRSILDALKEKALIVSTNQGHEYSAKGADLRAQIHAAMSGPLRVYTQFFPESAQVAIVLKGAGELSWHARDCAIANGAQAALVLSMKDRLYAAGLDDDFSNLAGQTQAKKGDAVIVAVAKEPVVATKAALASSIHSSQKIASLFCFYSELR